MDTVRTAIIVDFNTWSYYERVRAWVERMSYRSNVVLVVSDPEWHEFDYDHYPESPEWAAVFRNSKKLPDIAFKTQVLVFLQESSNLTPVLAVDQDLMVQQMFEDGGVLVSMGPTDLPVSY